MRAWPAIATVGLMTTSALWACSGSELSGALSTSPDADTTTTADADTSVASDTLSDTTSGDTAPQEDSAPSDGISDGADGADTSLPPLQWAARSLGDMGKISDLFAVSPSEAYAVGGARVLRWNGRGWATYGEPSGAELFGVWAGDGVVVVVGAGGLIATRAVGAPTWSLATSGTERELRGVYGRSSDDVWAFGEATTVLHWDGALWSTEYQLENIDLRSGWIAPGTSGAEGVYAVGTGGQLLSFAGAWKTEQIAVGSSTLNDIYGVGDTLFAVGTEATITVKRDQAPTWKGQSSNDPGDRDLYAVAGSEGETIAFGAGGAILGFDGDNKWTVIAPVGPVHAAVDLATAAYVEEGSERLWMALGRSGGGLTRDAQGAWVDLDTRPSGGVRDIAGLSGDRLYAVGRDGLFLTRGEQGWTATVTGTDADLNAVALAPDGVVWAVGDGGTVMRVSVAGEITYPDVMAPLDLFDVAVTSSSVWICGKGGTLLQLSLDGQTVTLIPLEVGSDLKAVAIGGDGALWLGGAYGALLRAGGGTSPSTINSGVGGSINDLAPTSDGVMAVGDNGVILDATASGVTLRHEAPGLFLFGAATADGVDFAVGWNGAVLRREGESFVRERSGVGGVLEAVWTDGQEVLAVGRQGTLIERLEAP